MNLGIVGQSVERVSFDYAVSLLTDEGAEIRIETAFSLSVPGGGVVLVEPEQLGASVESVIMILHGVIKSAAVAEETGTLTVYFVNGIRLEVIPNESYEAWTFAGAQGFKVVAFPGGGQVIASEVRESWIAFRQKISDRAIAEKNSQSALFGLVEYYRSLPRDAQLIVNQLLSEQLSQDNKAIRFDALAIIRDCRIKSALPALRQLSDRLGGEESPSAPYDLAKVNRLIDYLGSEMS